MDSLLPSKRVGDRVRVTACAHVDQNCFTVSAGADGEVIIEDENGHWVRGTEAEFLALLEHGLAAFEQSRREGRIHVEALPA